MLERYGMPDLIKIDVEGYEYNVLIGLTQKIHKNTIRIAGRSEFYFNCIFYVT